MVVIDYKGHIEDICTQHHITTVVMGMEQARRRHPCYRNVPYAAWANTDLHSMTLGKPITNIVWYVIALHELGHLLSPRQQARMTNKLIYYDEVDAWDWAQRHALHWTPLIDQLRASRLQTYRKGLGLSV